jgi:hypothetical protein
VVYQGLACELGKVDSVTPDTLMMVGSTGKTMTTMMMAAVKHFSGACRWDTPAVGSCQLAVADPSDDAQGQMRNLVCNSSGAPRDFPFIFNANSFTAGNIVASLGASSSTGLAKRTSTATRWCDGRLPCRPGRGSDGAMI